MKGLMTAAFFALMLSSACDSPKPSTGREAGLNKNKESMEVMLENNDDKIRKALQFCHAYGYNANVNRIDSRFGYNDSDYNKYQKWAEKTFELSKDKKEYALLIEKANFSMYLLKDGEIVDVYPVQFGKNMYTDKFRDRDNCTPHGMRRIALVKEKQKKIQIDFPTEEEIERYNKLARKGEIKPTGITGGVQIHLGAIPSLGRYGLNMSHGCITMSPWDYDDLYGKIKKDVLKMPVTIIPYGYRVKK